MKRQPLITVIIIGGVLTGLLEHTRLVRMEDEIKVLESARLQEEATGKRFDRGRKSMRERTPESLQSTLSKDESSEIRSMLKDAFALVIHIGSGGPMETTAVDAFSRFFDVLATLNHKDAFRLIEDIKHDPSLSEPLRQDPAIIHRMFAETNGRQAMLLALSIEDENERDDLLNFGFYCWLRQDPAEARAWFESESADSVAPGVRHRMIQRLATAHARTDPDLALTLAKSDPSIFNPNSAESWGESIADPHEGLRTTDEHLAFLAALRRAEKRNPGDPLNSQIRRQYVYKLCMDLDHWPFEEISKLIDTEFLLEEKQSVIKRLSRPGYTPDSKKWTAWLTANHSPSLED